MDIKRTLNIATSLIAIAQIAEILNEKGFDYDIDEEDLIVAITIDGWKHTRGSVRMIRDTLHAMKLKPRKILKLSIKDPNCYDKIAKFMLEE